VSSVDPGAWNALVAPDDPFHTHAFLAGLEAAGAVGPGTGWVGAHVGAEGGGRLAAALPLWIRDDSWGEYVFDHGWANAAHRAGLRYYPKLTTAIPFTPACAGRVLGDASLLPVLLAGAREVEDAVGASGHHVLFCSEAEATQLATSGYFVRLGLQFHWEDEGYGDWDGFLSRFTSRRRKELNRERRQVREAGIDVRVHPGAELTPSDWQALHRFYGRTQRQHGHAGYLPDAWFERVLPGLAPLVVAVLARRDGRVVAGALNFWRGNTLYGRYWGADEEVRGLHFEVCYHALVEWALAHGVRRVEAGAQGEHKLQRGFLPRLTFSAHRLREPRLHAAVADFCVREAEGVRAAVAHYAGHAPFASRQSTNAG
jgi:predicted N-acyltransferase